jgi:hypothetical protein
MTLYEEEKQGHALHLWEFDCLQFPVGREALFEALALSSLVALVFNWNQPATVFDSFAHLLSRHASFANRFHIFKLACGNNMIDPFFDRCMRTRFWES